MEGRLGTQCGTRNYNRYPHYLSFSVRTQWRSEGPQICLSGAELRSSNSFVYYYLLVSRWSERNRPSEKVFSPPNNNRSEVITAT